VQSDSGSDEDLIEGFSIELKEKEKDDV